MGDTDFLVVFSVCLDAMQVALAYSGVSPERGLPPLNSTLPETILPAQSNARFSSPNLLTSPSQPPRNHSESPNPSLSTPLSAKFHHVFIDLKAFVANICVPGETAELYFSLFNKTESRYVTDEYCAILNHQGISAKEFSSTLNGTGSGSENGLGLGLVEERRGGRMRTLFTGFSAHDILDELFLVCRIVKNGSIKILGENSTTSSSTLTRSNTLPSHSTPASTLSPSSAGTSSLNSQLLSPATITSSKLSTNSFEIVSETGVDVNIGSAASGMLSVDQNGRSTWRRPFGVAVLELGQFTNSASSNAIPDSPTSPNPSNINAQEYQMPIYISPNEASFSTLHEDIIDSRTKELEKSPLAQHIAVNVTMLYGSTPELITSNSSFLSSDIPLTPRLGFEDVVFPGTERNDCYLKLWSGDFSSTAGNVAGRGLSGIGNSTQLKNVEVSVEIRTRDGALVERVIGRGEGEEKVTSYSSMVFKANNNPSTFHPDCFQYVTNYFKSLIAWGELVKLDIPVELIETCHAFFSFRSRGAKGSLTSPGSTIEKPFAFAYFPLFLDNTAFMSDGSHKLILYKYESTCATPQFYYQAPAILQPGETNAKLPPSIVKTLIPIRDTMVLRSFLVSTTYTQNETLLKLLQWEKVLAGDVNGMKEVLTQVR